MTDDALTVPESCSTCRFFLPGQRRSTEPHDGSCHFAPPGNYNTPLPENDEPPRTEYDPDVGEITTLTFHDTTYTGWPIVKATDWCGSHEPRPT